VNGENIGLPQYVHLPSVIHQALDLGRYRAAVTATSVRKEHLRWGCLFCTKVPQKPKAILDFSEDKEGSGVRFAPAANFKQGARMSVACHARQPFNLIWSLSCSAFRGGGWSTSVIGGNWKTSRTPGGISGLFGGGHVAAPVC